MDYSILYDTYGDANHNAILFRVVPTFTLEESIIITKCSHNERLTKYEMKIMNMIFKRCDVILKHSKEPGISKTYKKYLNVYELLEPFTKEEVDNIAIPSLTEKQLEIIVKRSGGYDFSKITSSKLTQYERSRFYMIIDIMFNTLNSPEYKNNISFVDEVDKILNTPYFNNLIRILCNRINAILVCLTLGYNTLNKKFDIKEISKLLNMDEDIVRERSIKALKIYERKISEVNELIGIKGGFHGSI